MTTPSSLTRRGGFTLIELLVVIAIIVVLAALGSSAAIRAIAKGRSTTALKACTDLERGATLFFDDNGRYPTDQPGADRIDTTQGGANNVVTILLGKNEQLNPSNRSYVNFKDAKGRKGGLVWSGQTATLFDPWGGAYFMRFDDDFNEEITAPQGARVSDSIVRGRRAIAWSLGPDRAEGTNRENKDNVYSFLK